MGGCWLEVEGSSAKSSARLSQVPPRALERPRGLLSALLPRPRPGFSSPCDFSVPQTVRLAHEA